MITFFFHGRAGRVLGREWKLEVESIAEALRAIECNTGKLYDYLLKGDRRGIGYRVLIGDNTHLTSELELVQSLDPQHVKEVHFYPMLQGSGGSIGIWQIVIGIVMIVAAVMSAGSSIPASSSWLGAVGATMSAGGAAGFFATLGVAMVAGGITSLIVGQPKLGEMQKAQENPGSYMFTGAVNNTRQGGPIPLGYGEMIVGSQVVSLSIRSHRIAADYGSGSDDSYAGQFEGGSGGSGGTGGQPFPSGFGEYTPIEWTRLPEPNPAPIEPGDPIDLDDA